MNGARAKIGAPFFGAGKTPKTPFFALLCSLLHGNACYAGYQQCINYLDLFGRLKKMMHDLDTLEQFIKQSFPNDAHMPGMTVSAAASSAACPVGKVVVVVPGNKSELERTVCGKQ